MATPGGDATGGIIPYKNVPALVGYYLGIVALIPLVGFPFGCASIILGIMGLVKRNRQPEVKGSVHAVIAILFGLFSVVLYGLMIAAIIFTAATAR
ncbi:hypothetical protein M4951_25505 [Blastopirellula sp. J2-11]|uniref:hypothetical protein n=1 Tax=Blastopirellula sp. J2-11 TaxID=2943192 RepID=UPI0021CA900E|nr:hypothetical protein [Blastopirellula sp. J2-11]UUO06686.1 hypothetical protein M4951_25505 [Blastopirellula sp. J2-11]